MSWSLSLTVSDVNDLDELADAVFEDRVTLDEPIGTVVVTAKPPANVWEEQETRMQLRTAIESARKLMTVCGQDISVFRVNVGGHVNAGFAPGTSVYVNLARIEPL